MMKCIYSHEGGAYCDKHDHGAVTVCHDLKVQTNADRIRAMTDEELAQWICCHITECARCEGRHCDGQECEFRGGRSTGLLRWLKSPVEVDE